MKTICLCLLIVVLVGCGGGGGTPFAASYDQVVLADRPVSYWKLDEESGSIAADSSGNGWNGTYQGAISLGQNDSSGLKFAQFKGGFVSITPSDYSLLYSSGAVSIEAWYKVDSSILSRPEVIFAKGTDVIPHNDGSIVVFARPYYELFESDSSSVGSADTTARSTANQWHHVVVEFDSVAGASMMFLDGIKVLSTNSQFNLIRNSHGFTIGDQNLGGYNYTFSGFISDVSIYSYALSFNQVASHFSSGRRRHA